MAKRLTRRRARPDGAKPHNPRSHQSSLVDSRHQGRYVECSSSLITDLDDGRAANASGSELYGVLLGNRQPLALKIMTFRKLDFSLANHGSASLSEGGQQAFAGLMAKIRWDPRLSGLQPVGWFRAAASADLSLSLVDLEIFNRFFKEPWQVGLVLQTAAKIRVRFFLREADGSFYPYSGFRDVLLRSRSEPRILIERRPENPASGAGYPASRLGGPRRRRRTMMWPAAILLAAGVSAGSWFILRPPDDPATAARPAKPASSDVKQMAAIEAEAMWKKWEDELRSKRPETPLPENLAIPLQPESGGEPTPTGTPELDAEPVRRAPLPKPARLTAPSRPLKSTDRDSDRAPRPVLRPFETPSGTGLRRNSTPVQNSGASVSSRVKAAEIPEPPLRVEAASASRPVDTAPPLPVGSPPTIPNVQVKSSAPLPPPMTSSLPKSREISAAPAVPSSGRFIWTGRLRKNESITFDGTGASIGSSSGALPGRPVTFSVSPGDLNKNGMVIYSARRPIGDVQEPPGPQNGWNKTLVEWAPDRAADIEVVEAPGPGNAWKRLVVRSKKSKDSVIVVDWKALP